MLRDRIKELRRVKAGDLKPSPKNWREHPESQRVALQGILAEVGYADALLARELADGSLELVDGHLRAELDPDQEVPVLVLDLDEAEAAKLLTVLDPLAAMAEANEEALGKLLKEIETDSDGLREMLEGLADDYGLDVFAGGDGEIEEVEPQIDRAAELQEKWGTEAGQLWLIPSKTVEGGEHRVLCGDSTKAEDVERVMGGERAELVCTDPPYGVAVGDKNKYLNSVARSNRVEENLTNDTLDEDGLLAMLRASFTACASVCAPGASWYVAAPRGPLQLLFGTVLRDMGIWRQTIQWVKNNATFSPMGVCYHWRAEPLFFGWLPNGGHRWYGGRKETTVWEIDRPSKSPEHPTMKPVELFARAIRNSSRSPENILDPFLGSGTSICAGEVLGRRVFGLELDPKYVAVILERLTDLGLTPRLEP